MLQEQKPIHTVFVCAGSRMGAREEYERDAFETGTLLGLNGYDMVYGGGEVGLMGVVAHAAIEAGAKVIHSITLKIWSGDMSRHFNRMVNKFVETIFDRKKEMLNLSQAGIILVGGVGTFDELFEIMVANDVIRYSPDDEKIPMRPVILLNTCNYYDHMIEQIHHSIREGFTPVNRLDYLRIANTPQEVIGFIEEFNHALRAPAPVMSVKPPVYAPAK